MNLIKAIWKDSRVQTALKGLIVAVTAAVAERLIGFIDAAGGVAGV